MYKNKFIPIFTLSIIILFININTAQTKFSWNNPRKNLQVISDTTSGRGLSRIMGMFTAGLGVRCNYCHVYYGDDPTGDDLDKMDFASDEKPTKKAARVMYQMIQNINKEYVSQLKGITSFNGRIGCVNCHHGVPNIKHLNSIIYEKVKTDGIDAGIEKYKELREKYFGGFAYDFRESSLDITASLLIKEKKYEDAIKILLYNAELFPKSANVYDSLGEAYMLIDDKKNAIKNYEKSLSINPVNNSAIENLKKLKLN